MSKSDMKKAYLYKLDIEKAETRGLSAQDAVAAQVKITGEVKKNIKKKLSDKKLSAEFQYAAAKVDADARQIDVYATAEAAAAVRGLPGVTSLKRALRSSTYALTKNL